MLTMIFIFLIIFFYDQNKWGHFWINGFLTSVNLTNFAKFFGYHNGIWIVSHNKFQNVECTQQN
jgi:hypothetical protein